MVLDHEEILEQQWVEWLRCTFSSYEFTPHDPNTIEWALIDTPDPHYSMLIEGPSRTDVALRLGIAKGHTGGVMGWQVCRVGSMRIVDGIGMTGAMHSVGAIEKSCANG